MNAMVLVIKGLASHRKMNAGKMSTHKAPSVVTARKRMDGKANGWGWGWSGHAWGLSEQRNWAGPVSSKSSQLSL